MTFKKGDRVRDAEGHEGDVVNVYLQQGKVRVRWHKGFATTEYPYDLKPALAEESER